MKKELVLDYFQVMLGRLFEELHIHANKYTVPGLWCMCMVSLHGEIIVFESACIPKDNLYRLFEASSHLGYMKILEKHFRKKLWFSRM